MAQPIIIQDITLRNYLRAFQPVFGAPQWKYFVTVLMGLIHCQASRTLSSMLREVAVLMTVSGLSRFLISPAWTCEELARARYAFFCAEVAPIVVQEVFRSVLRGIGGFRLHDQEGRLPLVVDRGHP